MMLLLPVIALVLQQGPPEYPHAFPRDGTVRLYDDERITVWEVNWLHGVKQPFHRHMYDMAGVYLRFGKVAITSLDGAVVEGRAFEVPRPYFQLSAITHREEASGPAGAPERLAIMVDLKSTAPVDAWMPPVREGARLVLDNKRVRMWDYTWTGKPQSAPHLYDEVQVFFGGGVIRRADANGKTEATRVSFKDVRVVERGRMEREQAIEGTSPRAVIVEILR